MYHTMGQRQGLGIGGVKNANNDPWFVVDKDLQNNRLLVAQGHEHPMMMHSRLIASQLHWTTGKPLAKQFECTAKNRYRQADQKCSVMLDDSGNAIVDFDKQQRAITPGQSVVFYRDEECLGGGIIDAREHSENTTTH